MEIEVNGNTYWYDQAEEQALREFEADRRRFEHPIMTNIRADNHAVVTRAEMEALYAPQSGDRCHVTSEGTTYIHDGDNWMAQVNVNQGILSQIENSNVIHYNGLTEEAVQEAIETVGIPQMPILGRQGHEDFQRVMEEASQYYTGVNLTPEGTSPSVTIDVNDLPDGWDAESALKYYNDTGVILNSRSSASHLSMQSQLAQVEDINKDSVFLGNLER